ncbi:MAG: SDR family oxidoreductase [Pseudomonadota bacterium]
MSVILVTGSSTGIGQETALHFARQGHEVYASCRNPDSATDLRDKIAAEDLAVQVLALDLVKPDTIARAVQQIQRSSGGIDVLVANAGIGAGSSIEETELEVAREIFETNYFGNVSVLREVVPVMRRQGSGHVVVIGSLAGRYVAGCHAHYSASKWAMEGLCEALAQEMSEFGGRVSILEPGCVLTPIWTKVAPSDAEPLYPESVKRLGRFFEFGLRKPALPQDVAQTIETTVKAESPPFRVPVGKDAVEIIKGRQAVGDETWMKAMCLRDYDAFASRWQEIVGVDYYRD